ncbi:malonate--CoA ligase ACSF3, mitochondrial [Drosophila albomicans]|uniref:Malonate--CoA ligase ACSF3, mitochondrial n=1 Tax=Drosophila albomicans TaxID=7291 RepID=A0A6P8XY63_DROAB|nr:malonate--CoA ligase ACSF3, mitochondrial [Drosophila albomicans]
MLSLRRVQRLYRCCPSLRFCSSELVHKDTLIEKLRKSFIDDERQNFVVPTFKKAMLYPDEIAVKDFSGEFTHFQLYITAKKLAIQISNFCGSASQSNVAFLCSNNALWIVIQWACWISGQVAVPLEPNQAADELIGQATDCKAKLLIGTPECEEMTQELATKLQTASIVLDHDFVPSSESVSSTAMYAKQLVGMKGTLIPESTLPNDYYANATAMLLYTPSSANGRNGVLLTHSNIEAQMRCLTASWHLNAGDSMLPIISMQRMHTAIGALLGVGGNILLQQKFDSHTAWSSLLGINSPTKQRVNIFVAMPIIYKLLIAEYDKMFAQDSRMVEYIINHCRQKTRLMATAFGLLPEAVFHRWREITGQSIYEYYGMLETGLVMGPALDENSNAEDYQPGTLGAPLVGVTARLVNSEGEQLVSCNSAGEIPTEVPLLSTVIGELEICGKHLFSLKSRRSVAAKTEEQQEQQSEEQQQPVEAQNEQQPQTVASPQLIFEQDVQQQPLATQQQPPTLIATQEAPQQDLQQTTTANELQQPCLGSQQDLPQQPQQQQAVVREEAPQLQLRRWPQRSVEEPKDDTEHFLKTGDICAYQNRSFHFLSKSSDVFNVGGYKIYGSEIKKALISHPSINDVAVLGIPNKMWGHRLGVICILSPDAEVDLEAIKSYCYSQLPAHKRPTVFKTIVAK